MLIFVQKRYKKFIFKFRYYLNTFSKKLKTRFAIGAIVGFFFYLAICYYGLSIILGLVYDEEVAEVIDFRSLIFLLLLWVSTLYINLVLITKIIWDRIRRSPGTLLRFRVISFFFLSVVVPAILFIFVFDIFFERSIAIFDDQAVLRTMENKRWILSQEVEKLKKVMSHEFDKQLTNGFRGFSTGSLTYVGVYNYKQIRRYHYKKNNFSLQSVPHYSFNTFLSENESRFTSYDMRKGFIYQIRRQIYNESLYYFVIISKVGSYLKNDISETFSVIREVKQLELLLYPFKIFTIFFLIYVYSQIFSILAIVFYYSSNRYISPIAELIKATQKIIKGDYNLSLHQLTRHMSNNEIRELLESFSRMSRELINSRKRLERISNIEAWKDVSQKLAHEIKNPLTPLLLSANQIEKHLIKTDLHSYNQVRENFSFIETEIKRILTLLDEFSILTRQKLIRLEWVKTKDIVTSLQNLVRNYSFIRWIEDDRYQKLVYLDKDKMVRVLFNLVRNSIESLEELRNRGVKRDYTIKMVIYSEDIVKVPKQKLSGDVTLKNLVFEIWDNGVGILEEKRNEVFKPYVTYKSKGTGLGLAICDEIVSLHMGQIENFTLPLDKKVNSYPTKDVEKKENFDSNNEENSGYWTIFRITIPFTRK